MGKNSRAYKSAKRSKELMRQKKQEEKRRKRFAKNKPTQEISGEPAPGKDTPESQIS